MRVYMRVVCIGDDMGGVEWTPVLQQVKTEALNITGRQLFCPTEGLVYLLQIIKNRMSVSQSARCVP